MRGSATLIMKNIIYDELKGIKKSFESVHITKFSVHTTQYSVHSKQYSYWFVL